mmetsp:Transcript_897/g.3041  ORF Transcript_897/g.3041 Transcript_897/m.3041 type:complete len:315 (-) Transcript_897:990-1934(-)
MRLGGLLLRRVATMRALEAELLGGLPSSPTMGTAVAGEVLASWLRGKQRVVVLTGAGVSTASGIPDYRGEHGAYRKGHRPTTHDEFVHDEYFRKRYWYRALRGYDAFASSRPNAAHAAVAELQRRGIASLVITQNVDGLHEKMYDRDVVALHGRGDRCVCLGCDATSERAAYHDELKVVNGLTTLVGDDVLRPDGDADVELEEPDDFFLPSCQRCGDGVLKPDVVFFGDNVPKHRVDTCLDHLAQADGLLCCGSSLAVYSAFRFVLAAQRHDLPICVLNKGPTRADLKAKEGVVTNLLKLDADLQALSLALPLL